MMRAFLSFLGASQYPTEPSGNVQCNWLDGTQHQESLNQTALTLQPLGVPSCSTLQCRCLTWNFWVQGRTSPLTLRAITWQLYSHLHVSSRTRQNYYYSIDNSARSTQSASYSRYRSTKGFWRPAQTRASGESERPDVWFDYHSSTNASKGAKTRKPTLGYPVHHVEIPELPGRPAATTTRSFTDRFDCFILSRRQHPSEALKQDLESGLAERHDNYYITTIRFYGGEMVVTTHKIHCKDAVRIFRYQGWGKRIRNLFGLQSRFSIFVYCGQGGSHSVWRLTAIAHIEKHIKTDWIDITRASPLFIYPIYCITYNITKYKISVDLSWYFTPVALFSWNLPSGRVLLGLHFCFLLL